MRDKPQGIDAYFNRNKWVYSLGGIGRDMSYALFNNFLLTYILFTRSVTDKQFAAISTILVLCRIWDGLNDPIMGGVVENTRTRFGKFKPWIMIGCITNGATVIAMFTNRLQGWNFIYLFIILYLIWDITFTMNDIGYWSMMPSLTSKAENRDKIVALANLFSGMGNLATVGLVPMLTAGKYAIGGNSITAYAAASMFVVIMFVICQSFCCIGVKEDRNSKPEKEERIGLKKMFSVIIHNDQLLWATLITLLSNLSGAMLTAFSAYYIYFKFGYNGTYVTMFTAFYAGAAGLLLLVFPVLCRKFKRKQALLLALLTSIVGYAGFIICGTLLPSGIQFGCMCACALITGFGQNWFSMVVMVIFTNTIEYNEYKTGSRDEALIFSLRPFMSKMSSALQQLIVTVVYLIIGMTGVTNKISGYEQEANIASSNARALNPADINQILDKIESDKLKNIGEVIKTVPGDMTIKLAFCMTLIPIILLTFAYFISGKKNKIDEEEYDRMLKEIEQRKASLITGNDE
ncbi:MAG: glycoside-pentoside-hexuronide (GPH):cation symporter [Clostridia bacterium]|nr:glycoside-pentoside-hexuronide (GPH):cation symporter [Clostridia bacterium]